MISTSDLQLPMNLEETDSLLQPKAKRLSENSVSEREMAVAGSERQHVLSLTDGAFGTLRTEPKRAYDDTKVAVTTLSAKNKDEIALLTSQVNALAQCQSPFIVKYLECYGKSTETFHPELCLVTERCSGGTLYDLLNKNVWDSGLIPEDCVRAAVASVVLALECLHNELQLCHGNIQCRSIFLTQDGHVKLGNVQLGLRLPVQQSTIMDNAHWMAPEAIEGNCYDSRSDIWSLACTIIEMADGGPPHAALNAMRAYLVIPKKPSPTLSDPDEWSPEMYDFVSKCCAKDPTRRASIEQLASHPLIIEEVRELRQLQDQKVHFDSTFAPEGLPEIVRLMSRRKQV